MYLLVQRLHFQFQVLYDRTTGRSRGFAFVTMTTLEDCERVIKNLDGTVSTLNPPIINQSPMTSSYTTHCQRHNN